METTKQTVQNNDNHKISCRGCSEIIDAVSNFCPKCGKRIANRNSSYLSTIFILLIVAIPIGLYVTHYLGGKRPVKKVTQNLSDQTNLYGKDDIQLTSLRKKIAEDPRNISFLKELGGALAVKMNDLKEVPPNLALEAVDTFSSILSIDQKDSDALIALADLSFNQKIFPKAALYYRRYLESFPEDLVIKSKLASALVFTREFNEAEKLLKDVISKDKDNFHAHAYLAISLAEKGDPEEAKKEGDIAVSLAPNSEAKERIKVFLAGIDKSDPVNNLFTFLKQHEITRQKFVDGMEEGDTLILNFVDFPMQAMPQIAKDKFFSKILSHLDSSQIRKIIFKDKKSGEVMGETQR